jgi:hypothetical protein
MKYLLYSNLYSCFLGWKRDRVCWNIHQIDGVAIKLSSNSILQERQSKDIQWNDQWLLTQHD